MFNLKCVEISTPSRFETFLRRRFPSTLNRLIYLPKVSLAIWLICFDNLTKIQNVFKNLWIPKKPFAKRSLQSSNQKKWYLFLKFYPYKISLNYWSDAIYYTLIDGRFFAPLRMTDCLMSFWGGNDEESVHCFWFPIGLAGLDGVYTYSYYDNHCHARFIINCHFSVEV